MYRFCYKLSPFNSETSKTSIALISKRFLARGSRTAIESVVSKFDPDTSILDEECISANYLGIDDLNDSSVVSGGTNSFVESKEIKKEYLTKINGKYSGLMVKKKTSINGETIRTSYGHLRFDNDNIPKYHGQYENIRVEKDNLESIAYRIQTNKLIFPSLSESSSTIFSNDQQPVKRSDELFLQSEFITDSVLPSNPKKVINSLITDKIQFKYDNELLKEEINNKIHELSDETDLVSDKSKDWLEYKLSEMDKKTPKNVKKTLTNQMADEVSLSDKLAKFKLPYEKKSSQESSFKGEISAFEYLKQIKAGTIDAHFQKEYDIMNDIRRKEKQSHLDTKGYKILQRSQLPDYSKLTKNEIVQILQRSVVYENENFMAINKPYGLILHGSNSEQSGDKNDLYLSNYLPQLAEIIGINKLYTVHRLDRSTTGLLLLAKNQESAKILHDMFVERKILKTYLAITKNVPTDKQGIIDIPIEIGYIQSNDKQNRERSVLCPEIVKDIRDQIRASKKAKRAVTRYRIVDQIGNAALVEIKPETGIKHQIRAHFGLGLRCPILGDHKYSNLNSLAPQKLPSDILSKLRVRQQKVRYVPMHLHAYQLSIPNFGNTHRNNYIYLKAPLPYHFKKNAKSLGLNID